jgi:phenylpropionate dioxygenase-like ring-hydroxylating dioxygenase large terminal subunit
MVAAQERYGMVWENNFDPGHVAFVHRGSFGNPDRPELTDTEVTREPYGIRTSGQVPAADILDFDVAVENEGRDMLESLPAPFPLAPHLNAHARADRNSLAIRRLWTDLITGRWRPAY